MVIPIFHQESRWTPKIDPDKIGVSPRLVVVRMLPRFGLRIWAFWSWVSIFFPGTNRNVHLLSRTCRCALYSFACFRISGFEFGHSDLGCLSTFLVQIGMSIYFPGTNWNVHLFSWGRPDAGGGGGVQQGTLIRKASQFKKLLAMKFTTQHHLY